MSIYYKCIGVLVFIGLFSYTNESSESKEDGIAILEVSFQDSVATIPFKGVWTREFSMGLDADQQVSYMIDDDKIEYKMKGSMSIEYTIKMDKFIVKDNRWIGKDGDQQYVIFVKNITKDSISLFKQKVKNLDEATSMSFPSDTQRSQFTSWNVYKRAN